MNWLAEESFKAITRPGVIGALGPELPVSIHVGKSSIFEEELSPGVGVRKDVVASEEVFLSSSGGSRWSFDITWPVPERTSRVPIRDRVEICLPGSIGSIYRKSC